MNFSHFLLPALLLGCGNEQLDKLLVDQASDADLDGVTSDEGDCDDTLASVNPYSTDNVGDGIDQNCDGLDGEDSDGDGVASLASGGSDCDDSDGAISGGGVVMFSHTRLAQRALAGC